MAKCKVCGSRVPDGVSECPMCGAKISASQSVSVQETQAHASAPVEPTQKSSTSAPIQTHTQAKCKVCGSRIPDGAAACPMCGAKIKDSTSTESPVQKPVPVQPQENQNPQAEYQPKPVPVQPGSPAPSKNPPVIQKPQPQIEYDDDDDEDEETTYRPVPNKAKPAEKKNGGCLGKIIGTTIVIIIALLGVYFVFDDSSSSQGQSSTLTYRQQSQYVKIECEYTDIYEDDLTYNLYIGAEFFGLLVDMNQWNSNDKRAVIDAGNYVRQHQNLQDKGVYTVKLYKHYNNEKDADGWFIILRYSRRDDDFSAALVRF